MPERIGHKIYVDVVAEFSCDGRLRPKYLIWEDDQKYEIDKVKKIERCAARKGAGAGILYLCIVCGRPIRLFYEENYRWFLEGD